MVQRSGALLAMSLLFVASEAAELEPLAQHLQNLRKLPWPLDYAYEGIADGRRFILVANGAGPKLATKATEVAIRAVSNADLSSSTLEAVISTGYAGALDPSLKIGDIVVAHEVLDAATSEQYACAQVIGHASQGVVLSQDRIANHSAEKQQLFNKTGACAVEMEASGVAARAKRAGLPFCCIKIISDVASESFGLDLNQMRTSEGRVARGKIIVHALVRPNLVPGLLRLKRRTEKVARVLGDFLVSCRIGSDVTNSNSVSE
jgi:adenosylhomocysteine nucleosidase